MCSGRVENSMGSILGSQDPNLSGFGQFVPVQVSHYFFALRANIPDAFRCFSEYS